MGRWVEERHQARPHIPLLSAESNDSTAARVPEREIRQVFDIAKAVFPDVSPLRPVAIAGSGHSRAHAQVQQFARVLVEQMPDLEALGLTLTKIQTFGGPAYSNLTYGQAFMRQVERVNKRANTYVEVSRVVGYMDPVPALQGLGAGERDEIAYHVGSAIYLRPADQDDLGRIRWALVLKHDEPNTVKSNVRGRFSQEPWEVVPLRLRCLGLWHGSHGKLGAGPIQSADKRVCVCVMLTWAPSSNLSITPIDRLLALQPP